MNNIKSDFPIFKAMPEPYVYLDNAATTHKPYSVIQTMSDFYSGEYATVHRGVYKLSEYATQRYERARQTVASFIGASSDEIVFTRGTTEGINAIANTWAMDHIKEDDQIIVSAMEHHANLLPWQQVARFKKARLNIIPVDNQGNLDYEAFEHLLSPKTKLVAIPHVSHIFGNVIDSDRIITTGRAAGARILIDAAQSVPRGLINLSHNPPDFLVFSGHKMMGPTGIGVLYINKSVVSKVRPFFLGGGMVWEADYNGATWRKPPHIFEAGTPPIAEALGLETAILYLKSLDLRALRAQEAQFCAQIHDFLSQFAKIKAIGSFKGQKTHCVNFIIPGLHPHDIGAFFDAQGISVRAGDHCAQPFMKQLGVLGTIRLSTYFYNTQADISHLLSQIENMILLTA